MKDFIKWLGVNEKIAKVAVWLLIIMVFLIMTNAMLESIGFPNYQLTYANIINININKISNIYSMRNKIKEKSNRTSVTM